MGEAMGAMPVYDVNNRNCGCGDGYGMGGGWFMWVFFLFFLLAWGGGGFGGWGGNNAAMQGALTRAELYESQTMQDQNAQLRGITNGLCDGFYAQNTTMLQGLSGIQRDLCTGFSGVNAAITESRFAQQQCLKKVLNSLKTFCTNLFKGFAVGTCAA